MTKRRKGKEKETYIHSEYIQQIGDSVQYCFWCPFCLPDTHKGAVVLYRGYSLCMEHFKEKSKLLL